ncbi:hypothetical protein [Lysinibacillus xylanilyticus]|uniref:hypothetical protein n=1 Tax=Lysinibacillus xylanilyticus TaxID=582475 RepID=UPI00380EE5CE
MRKRSVSTMFYLCESEASAQCFICAKAKRQQQCFICAKAKRQQQCFICAKAKRQQQCFICAKAKRQHKAPSRNGNQPHVMERSSGFFSLLPQFVAIVLIPLQDD